DVNSVTNEAPAIGNFENRNKDGNTLCGNIGKYKPSDNNKSNEGKRSSSLPASSSHAKHPQRKKKVQISCLIDPILRVRGSMTQQRKQKKKNTLMPFSSQPIPSNSSGKSYNEAISDSFPIINRCNIRILSKPDVATSSESNEVDNTIDVGNEIGFTMTGKNKDIQNILAKVYAPQDQRRKRKLWKDITQLISIHNTLTILLGDFNEVRNVDEQKGTMFDTRGDSRFDNFISSSSLVDLPMGAKRFTRMNNLGNKLSKIDRVLVSQHVIDLWPGSHTVALPGKFSDHTPILLSNMTTDFRPSPFKFYKSWLSHKDFPQLVKECWTSRNNVNPPPTNNRPVLPVTVHVRAVEELHELQVISAFVDSRLESIEQLLNNFANQPNETNMNNFESDDESVDTPLVSPFPHSDNDSYDGEVLNELSEYETAGVLCRERIINSFDGVDLAF
ncbi:cytochrome P450, partial [Tanacetum coccineum]